MKYLFLIPLFFLFTCYTPEKELKCEIFGLWRVSSYYEGVNHISVFTNHSFILNDNPEFGCSDFVDGTCPGYIFGGYFLFGEEGGKKFITFILPSVCSLYILNQKWEVLKMSNCEIHLVSGNKKLVLSK